MIFRDCGTVSRPARRWRPRASIFVYEAIAPDIHLASISRHRHLRRFSRRQSPVTRLARRDSGADARHRRPMCSMTRAVLFAGEKASLFVPKPFPSMPATFWNDPTARIHNAYFARFPPSWCHGDFAEMDGSWRHHHSRPLRSTLNPGAYASAPPKSTLRSSRNSGGHRALAIGQTGTMTSASSCSYG